MSTQSAGVSVERNWEDTWHYAAGVDVAINDRWTVQGDAAYDTDPTEAEDRRADLPLDEQWRFAWGAQYRRANGQRISAQVVYVDYGEAEIDSPGFAGEYDSFDLCFF